MSHITIKKEKTNKQISKEALNEFDNTLALIINQKLYKKRYITKAMYEKAIKDILKS